MAVEVASAYVTLLPSARGFQSKLQRELQGPAAAEGARAGQTAGGRFSSGFTQTVSSGARRMFAPIIGGVIRASRYLALGAGAAVAFGLKTASSLEQSDVAFTTMLGSARKAHKFLLELQRFARSTPFEFSDVVTASQRLLAFGFTAKQVLPTLTAIGDAAAGLGAGAEGVQRITLAVGQIQAKGKVQSDELLQLTEQGIPALKILANGFGVTTGRMQKMVTKGIVPANKAIPLLLKGIEKGTNGLAGKTAKFGGLMDKQSKTLGGIFSNIVDTVSQGLAKTVKPLLPVLERELPQGMGALQRAFTGTRTGLRDVLTGLGLIKDRAPGTTSGVESLARTFAVKVVPAIGDFLDSAGRFAGAIAPMAANLAKIAGGTLLGGVKALNKVMGFLADHSTVAQSALAGIAALFIGSKVSKFGKGLIGGGASPFSGGSSALNPLYVWVVNGGGPGGPGAPVPTSIGKKGIAGRLGLRAVGKAAGVLGWGDLLAETVGPQFGSGGASKAFGLGRAYALDRKVNSMFLKNGRYSTDRYDPKVQRVLDAMKPQFITALNQAQRGNYQQLAKLVAVAEAAIKKYSDTPGDKRRNIRGLLLGSGFSDKTIDRTFARSRAAEADYKQRTGSALQDARLTKLERLNGLTYSPTRPNRPANPHSDGGRWIGRALTGQQIIVRGDLNVRGVSAREVINAVNTRGRTRALSGSQPADSTAFGY